MERYATNVQNAHPHSRPSGGAKPFLIALVFYIVGVLCTVGVLFAIGYPLPWVVEPQLLPVLTDLQRDMTTILNPNPVSTSALTATGIPHPTNTAYPTSTPRPTNTAYPTPTPRPTFTPIPTSTPIPTPARAPAPGQQTLGPIVDPVYHDELTLHVTVSELMFMEQSGYRIARDNYTFVQFNVIVENTGPGLVRSLGPVDFIIQDARGAMLDNDYIPDALDCKLEFVDLPAGGTTSGCIAYEVPKTGSLKLIYALRDPQELPEGLYLIFDLNRE
ncbi:MAG: DUF4352 domain-containing protein [Anaerolineae bacterium]|nr:DUF4352 domain-containing protein [Anaerolineae bacterium]